MIDVIVSGAGPAGSVAALVLARAGVRVLMLDRASLPRDKLCGDTLNPGAVATLARLGLTGGPLAEARRLEGMLVTGPRVAVRGLYGDGRSALALTRRALDAWLFEAAVAAGARVEVGVRVRAPLWSSRPMQVGGVEVTTGSSDTRRRFPAALTIGADGGRSVLARACGLSAHPARPRRWAFGVYATGVSGTSDVGEMHVRGGGYVGVAPLGGGLVNTCVVTGPRPDGPTPLDVVRRALSADRRLCDRFGDAVFVSPVQVLGPLAVECRRAGVPGLLLAGDAAGFVDPMTGDGLHLAIRGGMLAAEAALQALEHGDIAGAVTMLAARRAAVLGPKLRFNRVLRAMVSSPAAIELAGVGAMLAPGLLGRVVRIAGDAA